jgi:hypothetical protein
MIAECVDRLRARGGWPVHSVVESGEMRPGVPRHNPGTEHHRLILSAFLRVDDTEGSNQKKAGFKYAISHKYRVSATNILFYHSSSALPDSFFLFSRTNGFSCRAQFHARANGVITDAVNVYCNEEEPADVGRIALPRPGRA